MSNSMVTQTRIKQRFDTEQNWLSSDVVLLDGELAVVSCNQQIRFKVGNGVSSFSQLKYVDQDQLSTVLVAAHAISQGSQSHSTPFGLAAGWHLSANADFSQALGVRSQTSAGHSFSFVWNGNQVEYPPVQIGTNDYYTSHGEGTFNINPLSGTSGFYIGEQTLQQALDAVCASQISAALTSYYKKTETSSAIEISAEADALSDAISEKSKVTFVYWND